MRIKQAANNLSLLQRLDYHGELTAQIKWQHDDGDMPVRVLYGASGAPTAAIVTDSDAIIDYTGFWFACVNSAEANYTLSLINSDFLYAAIEPLMAKGQFGARHVQKHLWKLPIPEYDEAIPLHRNLAQAGEAAAAGVQTVLNQLREQRGDMLTVTIARRDIRKWLRESKEGKAVERLVGELLGE